MKTKIANLPRHKRFLLGFSGGADSSALFFLLADSCVEFDLAIVDYGVRKESSEEVAYAQRLAKTHNKQVHILRSEPLSGNFESQARRVRYDFFGKLIGQYHYAGVILAHQLNDRIEWLLMQFCKGAGLNTLLGFGFQETIQGFDVYRPLLEVSKQEIYAFCQQMGIVYFEDSSNQDEKYLRNQIRKLSSFLTQNPQGVRSSLAYLQEDKQSLYPLVTIQNLGSVRAFARRTPRQDMCVLDWECKKMGYVLSRKQKEEIFRCGFSCEIVHWVIECNEKKIFIFPKMQTGVQIKISKEFREFARIARIPIRLRGALFLLWCEGRGHGEILDFVERE